MAAAFFFGAADGDASALALVFFLDDVEDPDTSALAADFFFAVVDVAVVAPDFFVVFLVVSCVVAAVVVAVSFLFAQETKNAMAQRAVIEKRMDFFMDGFV